MTFYGLQPLSDSLCLTSCPRSWEQSCPNVPVIYLLPPPPLFLECSRLSQYRRENPTPGLPSLSMVSSRQTGLVFPKVRLEPLVSE